MTRACTARHVPRSPVTDDELLAKAYELGVAHDLTPATATATPTLADKRACAPAATPADDLSEDHTLVVLVDA